MKRMLMMVCAASAAFAADKIVGGPMAINVSGRSATVAWIVQSGEVRLGAAQGTSDHPAPVLRVEKASFSGLAAGQTYYYDIDGTPAGQGSFRTPAPATKPFEFVVFGDTRTRHEVHRKVVNAILQYSNPEFVLHSGDLVTDGYDSPQWPIFFEIEKELLRKAAFFPALGNHERNNRQFYEFFQISTPYYSFDWGSAHFIVLNSDLGNMAATPSAREAFWTAQRKWFEEDLAKSQKATYRFVTAHHPPITAVASRQNDNAEMAALVPLFEKYNVTAGFFGHDHNYQHFLKNGVHYLVSGGGGAPLYPVNQPPEGITVKVVSTEHFVRIRVDGASAKAAAIAADGKMLDEFEFKAR